MFQASGYHIMLTCPSKPPRHITRLKTHYKVLLNQSTVCCRAPLYASTTSGMDMFGRAAKPWTVPIQNNISKLILQKTRAERTLIVLKFVLDIFRFIFPSGKYRLCFVPQLFLEPLVLYCWIAQISIQGSNVQVSSISWLRTFSTFPSGRDFDCFDLFCCNSAGVGDDYGVEKICRTQASSDGSTKAVSVTRRVQ